MPTAKTTRGAPGVSDDSDVEVTMAARGLPSTQVLLAGLLAIQVQGLNATREKNDPTRPEVILAELGMTLGQIATLAGRNYESVKSTIRRAKART
jgi:DNA-directed RNA polymerase specialized sigma24 family protein